MTRRELLTLGFFLAVCLGAAALGGLYTSMSVPDWYGTLAKPEWTPPSSTFGPVWTVLYLLMGFAAWRVWEGAGFREAKVGITLFFVQLGLNVGWSILFFGFRRPDLALAEIVFLWLAILATARAFWRHDRPAALLLAPYLAWVTFAAALNGAIVVLN